MARAVTDIATLEPFMCKSESSTLAPRWTRWMRAFELFLVGKGITDGKQKRALLLHCAGLDVQDIFYTLDNTGEDKDYDIAKDKLKEHFSSQGNVPYERHQFRQLCQHDGESIDQFLVRLKQKAETCEFGDTKDEHLRDQIIEKCKSNNLRRKLLEKGKNLTLNMWMDISRASENADTQAKTMSGASNFDTGTVNKVSPKKQFYKQPKRNEITCFKCGYPGHKAKDPACPARNAKCRRCDKIGHFQSKCKSKKKEKWRAKVRSVNDDDESDDDYTFSINAGYPKQTSVQIIVGGVKLKLIVDSGSSANIVDRQTWEYLKSNRVKCVSEKRSKNLYPYGSKKTLDVAGVFWTDIGYGDNRLKDVEFVVIEGHGQPLLGCETAMSLGILKIVSQVTRSDSNPLVEEYSDIFHGLGKLKDYQLNIPIDDTVTPIIQPIRRIPYQLRDKLERKLTQLQDMDIIEPVDVPSKWISPIIIVPKGENDIRLCVDMRRANVAVKRVRYSIPTIDEVLQNLNNSKYFSKLDINMAYHQIELSPESREITTFSSHVGTFRYKRLMFGISCAPEMYQMTLQQILQGCEGVHNILDDIIVHSATKEDHDKRLAKVLSVLRSKGLTLNKDKCQFYMSKLVYMGHELSERGIGPTEVKVKSVVEAREPQNASELRSFLGLVQYSSRYIHDMATISAPLRELLRKNAKYVWEDRHRLAFEELKNRLARAETLGYYDKNAETKVIVDASPVGCAAVLVQKQKDEFRVITYASKSLSSVEQRYCQTEREGLACVWALERFHPWLYGIDFELLTDCKSLEYIYSARSKPSARLERWVLRLSPYRFKVCHIKGSQNIADALSRLLKKKPTDTLDQTDSYVKFIAREATPSAMTTRDIEKASRVDNEVSAVRDCILSGNWSKTEQLRPYIAIKDELCTIGYLVLRGTRILIPENLRKRILELAHSGHPGIVSMKAHVRTKVWWPGIDKQVERYCRTCHGCQLVGQATKPELMSRTAMPTAAWQDLAADVLGPLPSGHYIVVCIDYFSRFFEIEITKSITSEKLVGILTKWFVTHGIPLSIRTDNAQYYVSDLFKSFLKGYGIEHRRNTPLWPAANGEVERQNRSILKRLRISQSQKGDWKSDLNEYLWMYRSTPHSVTGVSPSELLYGRKIRTKIPEISLFRPEDSEIRDRDSEKKGKDKMYSDEKRGARDNTICSGDTVLVKQSKSNKLDTPFSPNKHTVLQKKGNSVLLQSDVDGSEYRRNITHVKRFESDLSQTDSGSRTQDNQNDGYIDQHMQNVDKEATVENECTENMTTVDNNARPVRIRKMPEKFKDYVDLN